MAAASVSDTIEAIDSTLSQRGPPFSDYSCKTVSWDDVSRGNVAGSLSCWGANITDTYLKAKDGTSLFTVRPDNWNEKLGVVSATDVALLIGNCDNGPAENGSPSLRNVTLQQFLQTPASCGAAYASLSPDVTLDAPEMDTKVSIRFQTVFLPVASSQTGRQTLEFATEAYNYNTRSDADPRNLILLATTQGLAVQADGVGKKRLLHHARDPSNNTIGRYWLEAERSDHGVGGPQVESTEERNDAKRRKKATAEVLGIKAMGKRFNTLMTVQIPLRKQQFLYGDKVLSFSCFGAASHAQYQFSSPHVSQFGTATFGGYGGQPETKRAGRRKLGASNAARVSRGMRLGDFQGLTLKEPERNMDEHVTVTVVFYNTVAGGVPAAKDVVAAIDDMERLLLACSESGRLADAAFDFMKTELKVSDMIEIADKVRTQPRGMPPTNS